MNSQPSDRGVGGPTKLLRWEGGGNANKARALDLDQFCWWGDGQGGGEAGDGVERGEGHGVSVDGGGRPVGVRVSNF